MNDSESPTHYRVVGEFGGCDHKHRTAMGAVRCECATARAVRRLHGHGAYTTARASAVYADGRAAPIDWHRNEYNEPVLGPDPSFWDLED